MIVRVEGFVYKNLKSGIVLVLTMNSALREVAIAFKVLRGTVMGI